MSKKSENNFEVMGRLWVEATEGTLLGNGRVELLSKIKEEGSLSKAAKAMKMSYRQAWEMIDSMNQKSKKPLVTLQKGGKDGGGAVLTESGEKAVKQFAALNERFRKFLEKETEKFKF